VGPHIYLRRKAARLARTVPTDDDVALAS
jgi:hypothetical protein